MHRILLADDDTIVRMYLTEIVNWKSHELEVVGVARNGEEALSMIHELKPDIVLTDISMPKMDGIQLIRKLREEGFPGVIDVLSCHDDFDLVKNAMKEGADDYLLKNHLNEDSVNQIIEKIREQAYKKQKGFIKTEKLQTLATKGLRAMQREVFISILRGSLSENSIEEKLKECGLNGKYRKLMAACIKPLRAAREQVDSLLSLCEQHVKREGAEIMYLHADILVMLIDLTNEPSMQKALEKKNQLQTIIQRTAEQELHLKTAIAYSGVCGGKTAISDALHQAYDTLNNSFYGNGCWQYDVDAAMTETLPGTAVQFAEILPQLLDDADDEEIRTIYAQALRSIREDRVLLGSVIDWLRECDKAAGFQRTEAQYIAIEQWDDCLSCVEDYLTVRTQKQNKQIPENVSPTIRRAIQYMYAHFEQPIGLVQVSQHIHLSSAYFSTLFKQEMNIGFAEFLLKIRMEWVCQQLVSTSQTIKQISMNAGFSDYPHFCKAFKKNYGVTPAAYRKQNTSV